jgi:hypothetical protein
MKETPKNLDEAVSSIIEMSSKKDKNYFKEVKNEQKDS